MFAPTMFVALCCNKAKEGTHLAGFRFEKSCSDWGERPHKRKRAETKDKKEREKRKRDKRQREKRKRDTRERYKRERDRR